MNLKLLALRRSKKVTQNQLASIVGLTGADISRIENGWTPPTDLQTKIAEALGASVDDLFPMPVQHA